MKRKGIVIGLAVVCILWLLTAVSSGERARKAKILESYLQSVMPVIEETEKLSAAWDELRRQSAARRVSDPEFGLKVLHDFMPRARELAERAESLSAGLTPELSDVHEELIKGLNLNLQAFSEVVAAVDTGDYTRITSANKLLSDARAAERRYVQKLEKLATEYGVKLK